MIQLEDSEIKELSEQWTKCSELRKAFGKDNEMFKQEFEIYENMMRSLGLKYGYDPEYVKVFFDGVVVVGKHPFL